MAIPKEGYFKLEQGRYGPVFPRTPANYGFTIIAKVKPGREQAIREYGKTIEKAVKEIPTCSCAAAASLSALGLVRCRLGGLHFMYQGIFDTDFDKYIEDAVALFTQHRHHDRICESGRLARWTGKQIAGRDQSSSETTRVQAFWNTENIRMSPRTKSRKRSGSRARYPPCSTRCSDPEPVHGPKLRTSAASADRSSTRME